MNKQGKKVLPMELRASLATYAAKYGIPFEQAVYECIDWNFIDEEDVCENDSKPSRYPFAYVGPS
jgi:hypothetical protein